MQNRVEINVDGQEIMAPAGADLLTVCLQNGIYIPHLCHSPEAKTPAAACRLCFVTIEGYSIPQTACTVRITEPLTVRTDTEKVRRLQRAGFNLLLSVHKVACKTCPANRKCALQQIARFLKCGLKVKDLPQKLHPVEPIQTHPWIDYWPNRCVLCGHCVRACRDGNSRPQLSFAGRGIKTVIAHFATGDTPPQACETCGVCVEACPVAAITLRDQQ